MNTKVTQFNGNAAMSANQTLSNESKEKIAQDLQHYVQTIAGGSANKASKMLKKVSNGYISLMINRKWDAISDEAWRNVQKQVSIAPEGGWTLVETTNHKRLTMLFEDARNYAMTFGIIGDAGCGKSFTSEHYGTHPNVYVVECSSYFNRRDFLQALLSAMGRNASSYSLSLMMQTIIDHIRRAENPVIILDEADKLDDKVLYFFISLYNALEGKCGMILMATSVLQDRIERGVRLNKKGYNEINSRLGRKFIELSQPSSSDQKAIIEANGIRDPLAIQKIINESEGDLRRLKRLVHAEKRKGAI